MKRLLFCPKKAKDVPLIVWIHGGAFFFGSKEGFPVEPLPLHLLLEGYAVASINYRLSSEAVFPAQLKDRKAAVRWLRANADEFGIDPNRIGVWSDKSPLRHCLNSSVLFSSSCSAP
jgi:acetyl esterase/lipase